MFYVVDNKAPCILSKETSINLGALQVLNAIHERHETTKEDSFASEILLPELRALIVEYRDIFEGTGALKDFELTIYSDESVTPVIQKPRNFPYLMRKQIEEEIDKLLKQDVIEPVVSPPKWVSPLVVVPKGDQMRLCVDMHRPNMAIRRKYYLIPTLDEVLCRLDGSKT